MMQGKTHNMVGISCALTATGIISGGDVSLPLIATSFIAGGLGSLVPDIDSKKSIGSSLLKRIIKIGMLLLLLYKFFYPYVCGESLQISSPACITQSLLGWLPLFLIFLFGMNTHHRTFMHSFTVCIASTICLYILLPSCATYYLIGYVSHLLLDLLNKKREQLLWPLSVGNVCLKLCAADGIVDKTIFIIATTTSILLLLILLSMSFFN